MDRTRADPARGTGRTVVRSLIALSLLAMALLASLAAPGPARAVIGGAPADPQRWDFVVPLLGASNPDPFSAFLCAGSVVAPEWILTSAHCVDRLPPSAIQVASPRSSLASISAADRIGVDRVDLYPYYETSRAFADIALLHLTQPLPVTAALPQGLTYSDNFKFASVAGWGVTDPIAGTRPDVLQAADVTILSRVGCLGTSAIPGTLCATFPGSGESAPCLGDGGDPLVGAVVPPRLLGIVSFLSVPGGTGDPLCGAGRTSIYTSVGRFRSWIVHVLRGRNPATSMPEFARLRARDTGRVIVVRATWCQTAAKGHDVRVDIAVWKGSGRGFRRVVRGRSAAVCTTVTVRAPDVYRPGRYGVSVKVKDQNTGMATPTPELMRGFLTIR